MVLAVAQTPQERQSELESVIERNLSSTFEVGRALKALCDEKLYRPFESFDEYIERRWGFERSYVYRLIKSYEVHCNVAHGRQNLVVTERALRPLSKYEPEEQRQIMDEAVAAAESEGSDRVTGRHIENAINRRVVPKESEPFHILIDAPKFKEAIWKLVYRWPPESRMSIPVLLRDLADEVDAEVEQC